MRASGPTADGRRSSVVEEATAAALAPCSSAWEGETNGPEATVAGGEIGPVSLSMRVLCSNAAMKDRSSSRSSSKASHPDEGAPLDPLDDARIGCGKLNEFRPRP